MNPLIKTRNPLGKRLAIAALSVFLSALSLTALGQDPVEPPQVFPFSNELLLKFFDSNQRISVLNRETQEKLQSTVAEHGMTFERFNQIARATQIGELQAGMFTDAEIATFNILAPIITSIQRDLQLTTQAVLLEIGISSEDYQAVLGEFRVNQALQEHMRELLRERARQAAREAREREQQQANPQ
ncbi:MAG TPA: hypothetical protein VLH61_02025 [Bacteroidales bacterium]|nr:hypothetical protein [Bacteroidales bacterium]